MSAKPVILRATAERDIEEVLAEHLSAGAAHTATRFVDAVEVTCRGVARHPGAGSPRYAPATDLPGLRHWELPGLHYLLFYKEFDDHVDVWRLLHRDHDIAEWMREG